VPTRLIRFSEALDAKPQGLTRGQIRGLFHRHISREGIDLALEQLSSLGLIDRQSFPSQIHAISPCVDQLMYFMAKFRSMDGSETDIEIALVEALENAVVHGNGEDHHKRVYVTCRCTADGVSITVQDDGQGFDTGTLPDPTAAENRLRTSGRGIYLMKALMDEVRFEKSGAVVHMRKKSNRSSASEE
jgi:serine/threonine-protein kinase RsbW